jgi:D-tyrosyl-tRNA(Tyr) deacylase
VSSGVRAVIQRVSSASVSVDGLVVGAIDEPGLLVYLGVTHGDGEAEIAWMARKIWDLRLLREEKSLSDLGSPVLVVSQFTLYGDTSRGRRPSWIAAARPEHAEPLVDHVVGALRDRGAAVATGRFRADMRVELVNDGPVTVLLEI